MKSEVYRSMIAKTGNDSDKWLPLWMHLEDTAGITEKLIHDFLSDSFANSCGMDNEIFSKTAIFIAYVHDIGKAITAFQYKIALNIPFRKECLEHNKIVFPDSYNISDIKGTPHSLASESILLHIGCPDGISAVAGSHHGIPNEEKILADQMIGSSEKDMECYKNYFGNEKSNCKIFESVWHEITNNAIERSGFDSIDELPDLSRHAQMLMSGLIITADWIASNTEFFPLISIDDNADDLIYLNRIENGWEKANFTAKWNLSKISYNKNRFNKVFGFSANSIQKEIIETANNIKNSGIMIVEAPMGCGKTESALAAAEILASKFEKNGLFFGLPTQATANGLFPRIVNWAEKQSEEFYHSIILKHSSADLNEEFQKIKNGINEESDSGLVVHNWFCDRKKSCLASFVTATVDNLLMMALKRRHVMLLHLGLSEKVVIIDEVHAYDAYMNQYLERALQWLGAYHTPVILLSATLPSKRRISLINAYTGNKKTDKKIEENMSYPILTWTESEEVFQKPLTYEGKHKTVKIIRSSENSIIDEVEKIVSAGGCVGIIMNTVKRVQKTADLLAENTSAEIFMYHAQYIFTDRASKENELISRIGKNSNSETRKGLAVIGTQVLEQSLDIDFDMLITDICPIDLLLQRIGRLKRHERAYRPVNETRCIVITDELQDLKSGSVSIYGEWLLNKTNEFLPESIMIPDDISPLVQKVYGFADESDMYEEYRNKQKILKEKANCFRLIAPKGNDIHKILSRSIIDCDAEESVRDGISSIEVIAIQRCSDNTVRYISEEYRDIPISLYDLSDDEAMRIAGQKLRLPSIFCEEWVRGKVINEIEKQSSAYISGWQKSYWLKDKLILFFDDDFSAELIGYKLHYSFGKGLEYIREVKK